MLLPLAAFLSRVAFLRSVRIGVGRAHQAWEGGLSSSRWSGGASARPPRGAFGSSYWAVLSCSSGGGTYVRLSRLALRALSSATSRPGRVASIVARSDATAAPGAWVLLPRCVLASRKSHRAASSAGATFQSGWPGASAEEVRANMAVNRTLRQRASFLSGATGLSSHSPTLGGAQRRLPSR